MAESLQSIAKMIDHSLLHPTFTDRELVAGCKVARDFDVASVCIKPYAVPLAVSELKGSRVAVGTVVGFPHGNSHIDIKLKEAAGAISDGATELDVVVNIGKVLGNDWEYIAEEVRTLNAYVVGKKALLKVIFENDFLPDDDFKIRLCEICNNTNVAFAKTSTGYGFTRRDNGMYQYAGATDHDLQLMREHCKPSVQIKAAGGIRTLDDVLRVKSLGVTRVGATATAAILQEAKARGFR